MKKIIIPFFCVVLFSSSVAAQKTTAAPAKTEAVKSKLTPKEVIDKYLTALGGKDKLESVKSIVMENTISGAALPGEITMTTKKMGNKFKSEQFFMGQKAASQYFDGEKGYMEQMGNKSEIPADKLGDLKNGKIIDALGYDYTKFKDVTTEKIDGKDYNVLTSDKGKFYFDASTGLLYKADAKEGTAFTKDYLTVDGIKFPSLIEAQGGGQTMTIKTTKVTINSGVTDADFK
ncbi:hypothetical protein [Chryseobacterium sp. C3]|uniref:hypothetical protein n=1 Tax=Chryseobacterium sp. C3 TaxID=2761532 RepID=UPI001623FA6F|nr:hypothetical protein [Chryseobacterium sp. C3]